MFQRNLVRLLLLKPSTVAALLALGTVLCYGTAGAQGANSSAITSPATDPEKVCAAGATSVDRATCLKEAGAAKGEAKRGQLTSPGAAYETNALQRCEILPEPDKQQCQLRTKGAGSTEGSIDGGGIIREVKTRTADTLPVENKSMPANSSSGNTPE